VWLGSTLSQRFKNLGKIGDEMRHAVVLAIQTGDLQLGLEWFEQCRSIIWGQILQLRTPVEDLHAVHPVLANKLQGISVALDNISTRTGAGATQTDSRLREQEAQAHRRLAEEWESTIAEVRVLPGLEGFLSGMAFKKLSGASDRGIIVALSLVEGSCDALIMAHDFGHIFHVPLEGFTHGKATTLRARMTTILANAHMRMRATTLVTPEQGLDNILYELWEGIVHPIFGALGLRHRAVNAVFCLTLRY
jgi:hypothetical protein